VSYFQEAGKFRYFAEVSGARPCAWSIHETSHPGHRPAGTVQCRLLLSSVCVVLAIWREIKKQ